MSHLRHNIDVGLLREFSEIYDLEDEVILDNCWGYVGSFLRGFTKQLRYGAQDSNSRYQSYQDRSGRVIVTDKNLFISLAVQPNSV